MHGQTRGPARGALDVVHAEADLVRLGLLAMPTRSILVRWIELA